MSLNSESVKRFVTETMARQCAVTETTAVVARFEFCPPWTISLTLRSTLRYNYSDVSSPELFQSSLPSYVYTMPP